MQTFALVIIQDITNLDMIVTVCSKIILRGLSVGTTNLQVVQPVLTFGLYCLGFR